ncbi:MAG TPA: hypothetical protein VFD08_02470 [Clostridia bacterium]|nr:hypothetical protein [Clostridia bacterium]
MKHKKLIILLLIVSVFFGLSIFSPTLARYVSEYQGSDRAMVARWDFKVDTDAAGLDDFDLFDGAELGPQASGQNSFIISPGESDVAIDYLVYMNTEVLRLSDDKYLPIVFRIASSSGQSMIKDWFAPIDKLDYFQVVEGIFEAGSNASDEITIEWKWDTSDYRGEATEKEYNNQVLEAVKDLGPEFKGNITFKIEGKQIAPSR